MKALVLNKPLSPLVLEERPMPTPERGQAVVQLKAAALNRRDYWIIQDRYPSMATPIIPGSDGAGVVVKVGAGVDGSWLGKEVIINPGINWGEDPAAQSDSFEILGMPRNGTLSEAVVIPAEQLHEKPAHLSWEEAAALPLAGLTAYRALFSQGRLRNDDQLLISGVGGGVATFALLFAVATGVPVWVTSSARAKIDHATKLGAAGGFLYSDEDWPEQAAKQGLRPSLVIDSAGGPGFTRLIDVVRPGGRIVNYGATAGASEGLNLRKVFWKQMHLIGSTMGSPREFEEMLAFVKKHGIKPVVDRVIPLEKGNDAFDCLAKSSQFGKVVVRIS
jgi:zinc-binding alcohol dehydrogenase/oxidoreductase